MPSFVFSILPHIAPLAGEATVADTISHGFTYSRYDLQEAITLIGILLGIIAVLLILILILNIRQRRKRYVPHGQLEKAQQVRELLQNAIEQRSNFDILLSTHGGKIPVFCTAMEVTDSLLSLECLSLKEFTGAGDIQGREITVFFRLIEDKKPQFFAFCTQVDSMRHTGEAWMLHLKLPKLIERRQKRGALRVEPPDEYVLGIAVWTDPTDASGAIPKDMREWNKSALLHIPSRLSQVSLRNISAGGVRLAVPAHVYKAANLEFNLSNRFVVLLDLRNIDTPEQRLRFWTMCRLQNYYADFTTQDVELGLQFTAYARPTDAEPTLLYWRQLPEDGEIEAVGNWTMRFHLEHYREHELLRKE